MPVIQYQYSIFLYQYSIFLSVFFFFWLYQVACRISVPPPGIRPAPAAMEVQSLSCWTTREGPYFDFLLQTFTDIEKNWDISIMIFYHTYHSASVFCQCFVFYSPLSLAAVSKQILEITLFQFQFVYPIIFKNSNKINNYYSTYIPFL